MTRVNEQDIRILARAFLEKLNETVAGDEERCVKSREIFEAMGKRAFSDEVIPQIVQELAYQGSIRPCESRDEVKITRIGKQSLTRTIENNAYFILQVLSTLPKDSSGRVTIHGTKLRELTSLTYAEINDAVSILEESRMVEALHALGTHPFTFYQVTLTPRGRYEYEHRQGVKESPTEENRRVKVPPTPIGSPFGFTVIEWEIVGER